MEKMDAVLNKMTRAGLSSAEWAIILEQWDKEDQLSWHTSRYDISDSGELPDKSSLALNIVRALIRGENCVDVLTQFQTRHGDEFWVTPGNNGVSVLKDLLVNEVAQKDAGLALIIKNMEQPSRVTKMIDEVLSTKNPSTFTLSGQPLSNWSSPLLPLAYLTEQRAIAAAEAFLARHPELIKAQNQGVTAASLLCTSRDGWDAYMRAGGSIFDPVYLSPQTGAVVEKGVPVWLWLVQKKVYHDGVRLTLESLMTRLIEDRPPQPGELVISDQDWQNVVSNKAKISNEMRMIAFEKAIDQDWKSAIKANKKQWRQWRSSEGANLMHWLACKQVAPFIKSAHKIKMNQKLIADKDALGRDIFPYFCVGYFVSDWGRYRTENRLREEPLTEALLTINKIAEPNPEFGVLAQLATSTSSSFFGKINSLESSADISSYKSGTFIKKVVIPNPKRFWNGFDGVSNHLLSTPGQIKKISPLINLCLNAVVDKNIDHQEIYDQLSPTSKLACLTSAFHGRFFYHNSQLALRHFVPLFQTIRDDSFSGLSANVFDQIEKTIDATLRDHYWSSETRDFMRTVQSWASQQSLQRQVQADLEQSQVEEVVSKKRRM